MMTSYVHKLHSTETQTSLSLTHEARLIYVSRLSMLQLQAEHQHAAGLIDLLFKGCLTCFYSCFATQASC